MEAVAPLFDPARRDAMIFGFLCDMSKFCVVHYGIHGMWYVAWSCIEISCFDGMFCLGLPVATGRSSVS